MRQVEYPNNTDDQVQGYLERALRIHAALELDDDLKVPAFEKIVDLVSGKTITFEQSSMPGVNLDNLLRN